MAYIKRQLKSCPFCGRYVMAYNSMYYGCPVIRHEGRGECVFHELTFYNESMEAVIGKWNTRSGNVDSLMEDDGK